MRIPLADTLRRIDRHWLLNHPVLWIMRFHWMVYFWLLGLALICLIALALPVSLPSVNFLNAYFWTILALAGMAVSPWIYLQARLAPQLRQNSQARTAVYLLAGYLFILGIFLAWPHAFVRILEVRISSRISESELRKDFAATEAVDYMQPSRFAPNLRERIHAIQEKYQQAGERVKLDEVDDTFSLVYDIETRISYLSLVKGTGKMADRLDPRDYNNWLAPHIALLVLLFLRIFQVAGTKNMLITLFFVATVLTALTLYSSSGLPGTYGCLFVTFLFLLFAGGYAALRAPRLIQRSAWFTVGMNIFTLLLAWAPVSIFKFFTGSPHHIYSDECIYMLVLGLVILFAVTPWIQRSYLTLQAKPS